MCVCAILIPICAILVCVVSTATRNRAVADYLRSSGCDGACGTFRKEADLDMVSHSTFLQGTFLLPSSIVLGSNSSVAQSSGRSFPRKTLFLAFLRCALQLLM